MISIRKFKESDAKSVSVLTRKALKHNLSKCYNPKVISFLHKVFSPSGFIKRSKEREYFVAVEDGVVVGLAGLLVDEVKTVFVDTDAHMQGIGRKLLNHVENLARKRGFRKVWVSSSLYAVDFYKKCGYKVLKRTWTPVADTRLVDVKMEKKI